MTKPVTVSALDGALTVTASHDRGEIHIVRTYMGQVKHRFLRAHENTQTELQDAARGDLTYTKEEILKAADSRTAQRYPRQSNRAAARPRRSNPVSETKAERAAKMYAFIVEYATAGKTVYLQTALRTTVIKKKHLPQVRVFNGSLEIQSGKRWLDYTWVDKVTAR